MARAHVLHCVVVLLLCCCAESAACVARTGLQRRAERRRTRGGTRLLLLLGTSVRTNRWGWEGRAGKGNLSEVPRSPHRRAAGQDQSWLAGYTGGLWQLQVESDRGAFIIVWGGRKVATRCHLTVLVPTPTPVPIMRLLWYRSAESVLCYYSTLLDTYRASYVAPGCRVLTRTQAIIEEKSHALLGGASKKERARIKDPKPTGNKSTITTVYVRAKLDGL
ncbi:hypothetical protein B0T17DRAFT_644332 [Bombardia bombarda]|uniref:Uncharacterized protein n=1 Tax=Bombardia bombarda TaxID=252184 RepID=A0AA39WND2_9PEZI|nr:hypothetical protein B0T17DRAFT_644332 [Bombardia bombarda]